MKKGRKNSLLLILSLPLAWLGLSGLVDNILDWHAWFEYGVMQHWRDVKQFLIIAINRWVYIKLTPLAVDYLTVGAFFCGASFRAGLKVTNDNRTQAVAILKRARGLGLALPKRVLLLYLLTFVGPLFLGAFSLAFWPVMALYSVLIFWNPWKYELMDFELVLIDMIMILFFSLIFFIQFLFVATDLVDVLK